MKKIISIALVLMMALSLNVSAYEDVEYSDVFNNPVFEIVAPIKDEVEQPSEGAELIFKRIGADYDYVGENNETLYVEVKHYSDGTVSREDLFTSEAFSVDYATSRYPAYIDGDTEGMYVAKFASGEYTDLYLIDTTGDEIESALLGSMQSSYDREKRTTIYSLFSAKEENGEIVRKPLHDGPLNEDAMDILKKGSVYKDGLKFAPVYADEYSVVKGFSDINDKVYFEDYSIGYFNYFYNIGYLLTVSNNGDILDYSQEDCEKQRVYQSTISNVFTGEAYNFYDVNIVDIFDSGYLTVYVKDEARNETGYIAKLKKHAVISVMVNGEKVMFDVLPTATDGRVLVPLRAIFESLGATIDWNGETQTITAKKGERKVILKLGSNVMTVDGVEKTLDVPAQSVDGRTLVPVRAISEAFGCDVQWNGGNNSVIINY